MVKNEKTDADDQLLSVEDILNFERTNTPVRSLHRNDVQNHKLLHIYSKPWVDVTVYDELDTCGTSHVSEIALRIEQNSDLMENNHEAEELRNETLKHMPQRLTIKKSVKLKISKSLSGRERRGRTIGIFKSMRYNFCVKLKKVKTTLKMLIFTFELWYGSLKNIEGRFGSSVGSYFNFLRWLFILNVITTVPIVFFIVVPQLVGASQVPNSETFTFNDVFSGANYFTNTILFYGFYTNETLVINGYCYYNMPLVYFYTMGAVYIIYFATLSVSLAVAYRKSFIETQIGLKNIFANKIFCAWDFSIVTLEGAQLKSVSIYQELKELLADSDCKTPKIEWKDGFKKILCQIFANIVCFIIIGGTAALLHLLENRREKDPLNNSISIVVVANLFITLVPLFFNYIVKYECYKSVRFCLWITLFRTYLLNVVIVGVLVTYWTQRSSSHMSKDCWATSIGQEVYRMIVIDFMFALCKFLLNCALYMYITKVKKLEPNFEFDIATNTLEIIFNQSLLWVGLPFAPMLPVVVIIKLFFLWYLRQILLLKLCTPSTKPWRAARTRTWFLALAFLSLLFICTFLGFILYEIAPSRCGPFRSYAKTYDVILNGIHDDKSKLLQILSYLSKPGVVVLIFVALGVRIYYLKAKAKAQRAKVQIMRNMLVWEAKDKEFLLKYIDKVSNKESNKLRNNNKVPHFEDNEINSKVLKSSNDIENDDLDIIVHVPSLIGEPSDSQIKDEIELVTIFKKKV